MVSLLSLPLNFETVVLIDVSKKFSSECSIRFLSTPKAASRSKRIKAYTVGIDINDVVDDVSVG